MAMAITVLIRPGPRIATMATASSSDGRASMMSIRRMMVGPSRRGKNPANRPSRMPGISDITTDDKPISSDRREPWIRRESRSRPSSSVPSRNWICPPSSHDRRGQQEVAVLFARVMRRHPRGEQRAEHDQQHEQQAGNRAFVLGEGLPEFFVRRRVQQALIDC